VNELTRLEKLTSLAKSGHKITDVGKLKENILFLCNLQIKTTACIAWAAGKFLAEMKEQVEHGYFIKFIENEKRFPFSRKTANQYMRLYEHYKDPAEMEKMGLRAALLHAGIIRHKERKIIPLLPDERCGDLNHGPIFLSLFQKPPLNPDAKLAEHRFEIMDNIINIVEKRYANQLFPILELRVLEANDPRLKKAFRGVMEAFQKELEKFFEKVEYCRQEDNKLLKENDIRPYKGPNTFGGGKK
jgi:hypothetical protein